MQERKAYFDDRLNARGIDYVAWDDVGIADHQNRTVTLRFPVENAKPVEIEEQVVPNEDQTAYEAISINDDLAGRGIRDIHVEVSREPVQAEYLHND